MGELAKLGSDTIKIGTCEDMYYLRYDQRHRVTPMSGSVNPVTDAPALRFRFPWPDEDKALPGAFDPYDRGVCVRGLMPPADAAHYNVQMTARGYVASVPCPESSRYTDDGTGRRSLGELHIHLNGFAGSVLLCAQKYVPGVGLVPILRCGGCGTMWRDEDHHSIEAIAVALRSDADRRSQCNKRDGSIKWLHAVADRVLAGIQDSAA